MKKTVIWAVIVLCLLSLFGCKNKKKNPLIVDGPDMEREVWSSFTLSACTPMYERKYSYTVSYDNTTGKAQLRVDYTDSGAGTGTVELKSKTLEVLLGLNLLSLPEAEALEGSFVGLTVIDRNGQKFQKSISSAMKKEILALIKPYENKAKQEIPEMLDGPDMMYTPPWSEMYVSMSSSIANDCFYFKVVDTEEKTTIIGSCMDSEGHSYETEEPFEIPYECLQELYQLGIECLDDYNDEQYADEEIILDDTDVKLSITTEQGEFKKQASVSLAKEIYKILLPYFQQSVK